ncbi:hypothetical protein LX97_03181 [Nonlabens dokdonensis]|jgi:hypothetical protein|uniref:Uncharacterized protein n=1 Tax=Nonlabens dokdonensis TaxID=328515 RepID=A0ABX5PUN2_9FLAO|nr:hypothetical protein LX97_03181 [Nonlabens dokdonensis]
MISNQLKSILGNRPFKIIRLYLISILCFLSFYYLETSDLLEKLLEMPLFSRFDGFDTIILYGLLKYAFLAVGICIIIFLSLILIKEKILKAR